MGAVDFGSRDPVSSSLSPLPRELRSGLTAVAVLATLSLVSSTALFFHLTYKLVSFYISSYRFRRNALRQQGVDFSLGLAQRHVGNTGRQGRTEAQLAADTENAANEAAAIVRAVERRGKREPNQFVVLLYNLLLADIHQAVAFFLNAVWVQRDAVEVGTTTCFAQGFFVSTGDLSASLFITAIAFHTYIVIVMKRKPPQWAIIATCVGLWMFNYVMVVVGYGSTNGGAEFGGFYVRAAAWCWMNVKYDFLRLVTHYLFIFISITITSILYILIFLHLRRTNTPLTQRHSTSTQPPSLNFKNGLVTTTTQILPPSPRPQGHNPAFLIYPVIYVVCTLPLALCRVATMAGVQVSLSLFCLAGALITSNGLLDTVLWATTRRSVVFGAVDDDDVGIETFAFMRTPHERKFGNMIWVQGAGPPAEQGKTSNRTGGGRHGGTGSLSALDRVLKGPEGWRELRGTGKGEGRMGQRSTSQESLRRGAAGAGEPPGSGVQGGIQLDLVTTVVVEVDHDAAAKRSMSSRRGDAYSGRVSYDREALPVLGDPGGLLS